MVKVRYTEGVAIHTGPESCAGHCREAVREALTGGRTGEVLSGESNSVRGADAVVACRIRQTVRGWALHERSDKSLDDLARMFNANIRGWINYYGRYYKSALYPTLRHIDRILARWAHRKFKSLRRHRRRSQQWLEALRAASRICSHTGAFCRDAAEQWEPDEARVSRPFLRERGGAIPGSGRQGCKSGR